MRRYLLITLAVLAVAFGVGAGIALLENPRLAVSDQQDEVRAPEAELPDFSFEDIEGQPRDSAEWSDKVRVVNFWATWCPPCRAETPAFVELQERYADRGVQFIGVAVDERELVADFADTYGVNYPMLLGGLDAVELSKRLGNRLGGLPFTVVVDRRGEVQHRQPGEMKKDELDRILQTLL